MSINLKLEKNNNLLNLTSEINVYFNTVTSKINLPKQWKKEYALENEIKKSFTRGLLRYSKFSLDLVDIIKKDFKSKFPEKKNVEWLSLPYPMIHLSGDKAEDGGFHYDGNDTDFFTCWVPITNYNYNALSIFKIQNKMIDIFSNLIVKIGVPNFFLDKIKASPGNIFFWNSKRIHKGNLNTSNEISSAIQIKLTSKIYELEQTRNFFSNKELNSNEQFYNMEDDQIIKNFNLFSKIINFISNNIEKCDEFFIVDEVLNMFSSKSMAMSFALSVLSQRIFTQKKFFLINDIVKFVNVLDLVSLSIGSANLISLKRLINNDFLKNDLLNKLKTIDVFKTIPFDTFQFLSITKNLNSSILKNNYSY